MNGLGRKEKKNKDKQLLFTKETLGVVLVLFSTLCLVCLISRDAIFYTPGAWINAFLFGTFGYLAYAVITALVLLGVKLIIGKKIPLRLKTKAMVTAFFIVLSLLLHVLSLPKGQMGYGEYLTTSYLNASNGIIGSTAGGIITAIIAYPCLLILSEIGCYVVFGLALAGITAIFVKGVVVRSKERAKAPKTKTQKFKSSYVDNSNRQTALDNIEIEGEKEYPDFENGNVETSAPAGATQTQRLFVNNAQDFAFKTKREMNKGVDAPIKLNQNGGIAIGTIFSSAEVEKQEYQKKIEYIKTPASIDVNGNKFASNPQNQTVVSDYIPKTDSEQNYQVPNQQKFGLSEQNTSVLSATQKNSEEPVKVEPKREDSQTRDIPLYEHNEGNSKFNDVRSRAVNYTEKYVDLPDNVETVAKEPEEVFRPIDKIEDERQSQVKEQNQEVEFDVPVFIDESDEQNQGFEEIEPSAREDEQVKPSNIVRDRRARDILFGTNEKLEKENEQSFTDEIISTESQAPLSDRGFASRPAFTSRAEIDNNRSSVFSSGAMRNSQPKEEKIEKVEKPKPPINRVYKRPPIDLLERHTIPASAIPENHQERMEIIKRTLEEFHISAEPQSYVQGPAVTRYEVMMPAGISVKRVLNYDNDLKMRLASKNGIRIEAPIPGKNLVGIEVANNTRVPVGLREVLEDYVNTPLKPGALTFAIGKDIVGNAITDNLAKGPHYLVAGATGSGKSVALNVMIVSLIMRYSPEEMRLILIDPKRVGFRIYEHIPHLMIDEIVTEPQKAVAVLNWAYNEMEKRYAMFESCEGVISDIDAYNQRIASDTVPKMPRIVIVVDELADLMESCKKDMDIGIRKLAAKARAAGVHLVLATQRPSVDVITGTIKANLPSRMALKVMNFADSSTILSEGGAEKLLGNGDMLYKNSSMSECERYQGAWISDSEINNVVSYIKENNASYFDDDLKEFLENATRPKQEEGFEGGEGEDAGEINEFFLKALWLAVNTGTVSISQLQRRFQIGYARAGGLVDKMERLGFVSSNEGSKARRVLLTRAEFEDKFGPMSDVY